MADSKHSDLGIPTRSTARKFMPDSLSADQCEDVLNYLENLGVVFAPEPVAEPEDPKNCRVTDARDSTWRKYSNSTDYWTRIHDGTESAWAYIEQPIELFRKVDTPEPAPKYVAERISNGDIKVGGYVYYQNRAGFEDEIARRQAALDLLDRESDQAIDQLRDKLAGEGGRS